MEYEVGKPRKKIRGHKNSCGEKRKFETLEQAQAASKINRFDYMQAYKCKKCKFYHYGHPRKV